MRKKKLYYLPGLISIIGLPVLLFFWGPADPVRQNILRLNIPSDVKDTPGLERFTTNNVYKIIKNKKIITVDLDDLVGWDESRDYLANRKYKFIQSEMERLQFTADTNAVLKIHFGSQNNYSEFVWVLNHAVIYNFKRYALVGDDFYFLPTPHRIPSYETMVIPYDYSFEVPEIIKPTAWQSFKIQIKFTWRNMQWQLEYLFSNQKQNVLLAAGFLLLILIPAFIRINKYKRNNNSRILQTNASAS